MLQVFLFAIVCRYPDGLQMFARQSSQSIGNPREASADAAVCVFCLLAGRCLPKHTFLPLLTLRLKRYCHVKTANFKKKVSNFLQH